MEPPPTIEQANMRPASRKGLLILITLISIMLLGSVALNISSFLKQTGSSILSSPPTISTSENSNGFFDTQVTSVQGKITEVEGNKVTVENQRGATQQFKVSPDAVISDPNPAIISTPLTDLKRIELNKPVYVNFTASGSEYVISSINVIVDLSSPGIQKSPTQSTNSATPAISIPPTATTSASPKP